MGFMASLYGNTLEAGVTICYSDDTENMNTKFSRRFWVTKNIF